MICLIPLTSPAFSFETCGTPAQGKIVQISSPQTAQIIFQKKTYLPTKDGNFIIAFSRDESKKQLLTLINKDGKKQKQEIKIAATKWDIQDIKGLPQKKVTPAKTDETAIKREQTDVRQALLNGASKNFWQKGFVEPVEGRISGNFGGQRIMNGEKRNPHLGADIAALEGTEIKAASDGVVKLAGLDYFYSGNVVIIDHGFELFTIYAHMKDLKVKPGQKIKKGQVIGTVGKTGRATGAHLHWGASLNNVRFDPYSLLNLTKNCIQER